MTDESESNNIDDQEESLTEEERSKDEEEKNKLLKEIEELQQFINNAERTLSSLESGNVEIENEAEFLVFNSEPPTSPSSSQDTDSNVDVEYELYKMAGLYCTKSTDTEFVFNMSTSLNNENSSAVQFFVENDRIILGRWVLPLGITINDILVETPLEEPVHSIAFLRNCKRHVLCYEQRKEQFDKFKESLSTITNCTVNTNYGYLTIFVDLHQVKNKSTDEDLNLTISLFYSSGKVTPHTLKVDWHLQKSPSKELTLHLRSYIKPFKNNNLEEAFKQIVEIKHPIFEWEPEIYVEKKIIPTNMVKSTEVTTESEEENDSYDTSKKRKQPQLSRQKKSRKVAKEHSISPEKSKENSNDNLELTQNKPTSSEDESQKITGTSKAPKVKMKKSRRQKKLVVTNKKLQPKKTEHKSQKKKTKSDRANNIRETLSKSLRDKKNVEKSSGEKKSEPQKSETEKENKAKPLSNKTKSEKSQKQITEETENIQKPPRLSEIKLNTPSTKVSDVVKNSDLNKKKKNYTSTPVAGNMRKTRQMTLNLSPIISNADQTGTKDTKLRSSSRK